MNHPIPGRMIFLILSLTKDAENHPRTDFCRGLL
jgi:hypothetical protein